MSTRTIVYRYGALAPIEGKALYEEQTRLGHQYRNRLVAIERRRRDARDEAIGVPEEIRKRPRRTWSPGREPGTYRTAADWKEVARLRREATDETKVRCKAINAEATAAARQARAESGLAWGTYQAIEFAVKQAKAGVEDPQFRRWNGSGRVAVHFQDAAPSGRGKGADVADVLACTGRWLRIEPPPGPANRRGHRRGKAARTTARLRLETLATGEPAWVTLPIVMCRALPPEGVISWATVVRQRLGPALRRREPEDPSAPRSPLRGDARYWLCLTVTAAAEPAPAPTAGAASRIAIDVGWRRRDDGGLRAGYWADDAGAHGELRLPGALQEKMDHVESIRSTRDGNFNNARAMFTATPLPARTTPDWIREATRWAPRWRSPAKLARLVTRWRGERFNGDETIFAPLDAWERQDRHLWRWEACERDKVLRRRDAIYAEWAADFAKRYATIIVEDFNLRRFVERERAERNAATDGTGEKPRADRASAQRHLVAPGTLRATIERGAARRERAVKRCPCAFTTRYCHIPGCDCQEPWDQAREVEHRCVRCNNIYDQDYNACRNLLASEKSNGAAADAEIGQHHRTRPKRQWAWRSRRKAQDAGSSVEIK